LAEFLVRIGDVRLMWLAAGMAASFSLGLALPYSLTTAWSCFSLGVELT